MNVYFIFVWCTVIFGCLSVPQKRHKHVRYPVQTIEDLNRYIKNQSATEVVENKYLLKKNSLPHQNSPHKKYLVRSKHNALLKHVRSRNSNYPSTAGLNLESTSQMNVSSSKYGFLLNGCVTSLVNKSPNCNPRKNIKQSKHIKRSYELSVLNTLVKATMTTAYERTSIDDFFGLFVHEKNRNLSNKSSASTKTVHSINITTPVTDKPLKRNLSTRPIVDRPLKLNSAIEQSTDSYEPMFNYSQDYEGTRKKILVPVESKLLAETKMLYLDSEKSNNHRKFYQELNEGGGGEGNEETEGQEETTEEMPEDSTTEMHVQGSEEGSSQLHSEATPFSTTLEAEREHENGLDLDSTNSAKKKCQIESKRKCVCSFSSLITSIKKIFSIAVDSKTVLKEASRLGCTQYAPIPEAFDLSSSSQPKVLSANKKPMAVDGGRGPKEIEEHSLFQFIQDSVDDEDDEVHAFVNTDVKISCFPTSDVHLSASDTDHVMYKWTRGNKQAITDGRMTENWDGEGGLLVEAATLVDSENYTCDVDYVNPDTGRRTADAFVHPLTVVTLPTVTARATLHLRSAGGCDAGLLEVFQLYLPQLVEAALCGAGPPPAPEPRLCSVQLHSPACHSGSSQESTELSLSLEAFLHRQAEQAATSGGGASGVRCEPKCHLVLALRLLQIFKDSLTEIVAAPVIMDHGARKFTPVANSVKIKYIFGCIGGYHLDSGFCVACPKHTYSEDGDTECTKCPPHSYQGSLGARRCIPCSVAWIPTCNEYMESENVWMIVGVVATVAGLLAGFAIWYTVSVKNKKLADVKKLVAETPLTRRKKVKFGKTQKSMRRKQLEKAELQSLLETSSDVESATDSTVNKKRKKGSNGDRYKRPKVPVIVVTDSEA